MSEASKAVFLSYASQDAAAAQRICEALRAAGVEVWFDQNELVGGDAWDAKIRKQIAECALFVPIISAATQARREGYFRLEWRIAAQRTHMMSESVAFLLPVVIDATRDAEADVPAEFKGVQWTRLPGGEAAEKFCARVKALLAGPAEPHSASARAAAAAPTQPGSRGTAPQRAPSARRWLGPVVAGAAVVAALAIWRPWEQPGKLPTGGAPLAAAAGASARTEAAPLSEARKLERQARALMDDDPLSVRENFKAAGELAEKAAALSPDDGEIWATLARANLAMIRYYGDRSDARRAASRSQVERAIRLAPQSIEAELAMAIYEGITNPSRGAAQTRLISLLERAPADRRVLRQLIRNAADADDFTEAARWLARAEALPGGDARALVHMGWLHWALNQLPEVLALVDRSLALQPTTDAYHLKLMGMYVSGNLAGAREFLAQVPASILQEDRVAMIAYQIWLFSREPDKALAVLSRVPREILEEGRFFGIRGLLAGDALLLAGRSRAAEAEFHSALKVADERLVQTPRDTRAIYARARILARLGNTVEAARSLELAREVDGRTDTISDADVCVVLGRTDEAITTLDKIIHRERTRWPSALLSVQCSPMFDPVRKDPRVQAIIARGEGWLREMMNRPGESRGAPATSSGGATSPVPPATIDEKSVAVLAFANLSDDKANEYFSDGISEELLNVLAKVPGLKVSARTSAFFFKGKEVPIPEIAQKLGVAYVVEGSVRKAGNQVRITAQLIKAADGFHVWSETFTRDLKDIFAVQDEIAALIARNLQLKISATNERQSIRPEVYELLLQARAQAQSESTEGRKRAIALYRRALAAEPRLPAAWAGIAHAYVALGRFGGLPIDEGMREARSAAQQALALDPNEPRGMDALALVQRTADWDWRGAQRSVKRAMELAPGDPAIMGNAAVIFFNVGRVEEAIALARQAVERDPFSVTAQFYLGVILEISGRWEESLGPLRRAVELAPTADEFPSHVARSLISLGRLTEAEKFITLEPNEAYRLVCQAQLRRLAGDAAGALQALDQLTTKYGAEMPGYVALTAAMLGDKEQAFLWLDRAVARRDAAVAWAKTNHYLRALQGDRRWNALLSRLGLADDQLK